MADGGGPGIPDELFAWVGEDELGSGEAGLKQAATAVGLVPLVAVERRKVDREGFARALKLQADVYGRPIALVRYVRAEVLTVIEPGSNGHD